MNKVCFKCGKQKKKSDFYRDKSRSDGLQPKCKECEKSYKQTEKYKNGRKLYFSKNKKKINKQKNIRYHIDIKNKLSITLRNKVVRILKHQKKSGSAIKDLGCTLDELKKHIEKQFKKGMSWDNWTTNGWHVDHIIPLISFDLTDRKQFLKAVHFTNLQPLWAEENLSKGCKINKIT